MTVCIDCLAGLPLGCLTACQRSKDEQRCDSLAGYGGPVAALILWHTVRTAVASAADQHLPAGKEILLNTQCILLSSFAAKTSQVPEIIQRSCNRYVAGPQQQSRHVKQYHSIMKWSLTGYKSGVALCSTWRTASPAACLVCCTNQGCTFCGRLGCESA